MKWLIDAHCHLDDDAYDDTREEIISRLVSEGVAAVIDPGCDAKSSEKAVALAKTHERLYACVGTHPHEASGYTDAWEARMRVLAQEKKVVAIGEIGLDYHYDLSPRKTQWAVFERQLELARSLQMPVVIHSREAAADNSAILKNFGSSIRALLHSYNETWETWEELAEFGYFISLGGMVTFKTPPWPRNWRAVCLASACSWRRTAPIWHRCRIAGAPICLGMRTIPLPIWHRCVAMTKKHSVDKFSKTPWTFSTCRQP